MIIKCPECGKEVSDRASVCPNCGYPLKGRENEDEYIEEKESEFEEKEECIPKKESPVSIISLVCFISAFIFAFIFKPLGGILGIISLVLAVIASYQNEYKDTCGAIVMWANIIGIALFFVIGFLQVVFQK